MLTGQELAAMADLFVNGERVEFPRGESRRQRQHGHFDQGGTNSHTVLAHIFWVMKLVVLPASMSMMVSRTAYRELVNGQGPPSFFSTLSSRSQLSLPTWWTAYRNQNPREFLSRLKMWKFFNLDRRYSKGYLGFTIGLKANFETWRLSSNGFFLCPKECRKLDVLAQFWKSCIT